MRCRSWTCYKDMFLKSGLRCLGLEGSLRSDSSIRENDRVNDASLLHSFSSLDSPATSVPNHSSLTICGYGLLTIPLTLQSSLSKEEDRRSSSSWLVMTNDLGGPKLPIVSRRLSTAARHRCTALYEAVNIFEWTVGYAAEE